MYVRGFLGNGKRGWVLRQNNNIERYDGTVVFDDGTVEYWVNGELHREDGPAAIYANGLTEWWVNGKLNREDGPAVTCVEGTKAWYVNGKRHREDGPAIIQPDGTKNGV